MFKSMVLKGELCEVRKLENAMKTQCIKKGVDILRPVSYTHLTLPTNREV